MLVLATPIVDWTAMWKICLVTLAAGAGVVILFGFVLLGLKFAQGPATQGTPAAAAGGAGGGGAHTTGTEHTNATGTDHTNATGTDHTNATGTDHTNATGTDHTNATGTDHTPSAGARLGGFTLSLVCGLLCVGVVAIGVYAMTKKPSSTPAKGKAKSALVIPAGPGVRLTASTRLVIPAGPGVKLTASTR